jgi:hypothetical protein
MRDRKGAVTVLAINAAATAREIDAPMAGERYTLTAPELQGTTVQLNGKTLVASDDGKLPPISGSPTRAGKVRLPATSITFLTFPQAGNQSCQGN